MERTKEVKIPLSLYRAIEEKIEGSNFLSVSEFITYAARKALTELGGHREQLSEEEKEEIRERLRALGYL